MKYFISILFLLTIAGCSTSRVNVDTDSCQSRGVIDGIKVGSCEVVKVVK